MIFEHTVAPRLRAALGQEPQLAFRGFFITQKSKFGQRKSPQSCKKLRLISGRLRHVEYKVSIIGNPWFQYRIAQRQQNLDLCQQEIGTSATELLDLSTGLLSDSKVWIDASNKLLTTSKIVGLLTPSISLPCFKPKCLS